MRNRSRTVRGHLGDRGVDLGAAVPRLSFFVVRGGELTGALPGRVLDGPEELRGRPEPLRPTSDG